MFFWICWAGDGQGHSQGPEREMLVKRWSRKKQIMKKEVFLEYVGQVMVKSVKKRRFSGYVGQVMAKDADG